MLTKLIRGYWYPGHPGYKALYQKYYMPQVAKIEELDFMNDPIDKRQMIGSHSTTHGFEDPVLTIIKRMKHQKGTEISSSTISYLCYNGAKSNIDDNYLWREVNFFIAKTMIDLDDRMIYGCMYGLIRSGKSKKSVLDSVIKEFNERVLNTLTPYQIFEMIEACCLNKNENFDAVEYMDTYLMPIFKENFKRCRFLFIESYLLKLITNLAAVDYYEPWVWDGIFNIIFRKKFGDIDLWVQFYHTFISLRETDIESGSGISFDKVFEHLEGLWSKHPDFRWKYNLEERRFFTVDEMVERVKDTPVELTWQQGEEHVKHQLPEWYYDSGEPAISGDMADLLGEYENSATAAKKLSKKSKKR